MAKMEQAFNHNTQLFISTMQMLEVQGQAFRQVLDDFHQGVVSDAVHKKEDGAIDWQHYLQVYLEKLKAAQKPADPAPSPVIASPSDEEPIIFGGTG
jgi:hypothetical protein